MDKLRDPLKLVIADVVPCIEEAGMVRQLVLVACLAALGGCANPQAKPDDGFDKGWSLAKFDDYGRRVVAPGLGADLNLSAIYAGEEMAAYVEYSAHGLTHEIEHADLGREQAANVSASAEKLIGAMSDPNPNAE